MKRLLRSAILTAVAGGALAATAQDSFDFYAANVGVLQFREVQKEMGVGEAQRAKLNKHAEWFNSESKRVRENLGKSPTEAQQRQAAQRVSTLMDQLKQRCLKELTPSQLRRLREISLQGEGPKALLDDKVAAKIGLSAASLKALRDRYTANGKKSADIQQRTIGPIADKYQKMNPKTDADRKKAEAAMQKELEAAQKRLAPQLEALTKDFLAFADKTLSAKQKQAWTALLGKPFTPQRSSTSR